MQRNSMRIPFVMLYIPFFFIIEDLAEVKSPSSMSASLVKMGTGISWLWETGRITDCMPGYCKCCLFYLMNPWRLHGRSTNWFSQWFFSSPQTIGTPNFNLGRFVLYTTISVLRHKLCKLGEELKFCPDHQVALRNNKVRSFD